MCDTCVRERNRRGPVVRGGGGWLVGPLVVVVRDDVVGASTPRRRPS